MYKQLAPPRPARPPPLFLLLPQGDEVKVMALERVRRRPTRRALLRRQHLQAVLLCASRGRVKGEQECRLEGCQAGVLPVGRRLWLGQE